ncbi:MAG: arsenic resistance protein [Luteimonas sp.]
MNRLELERRQIWIYLAAIAAGLLAGNAAPGAAAAFGSLLWPALALLLYAAFVQVPMLQWRQAIADRRFTQVVLAGNFLVMPVVAWLLLKWLPPDPALRVGVLLVLLVPCTDWFIAFTQLGRGDVARAAAVTPVNLLLQIVLTPAYVWLIGGRKLELEFEAGAALAVLAVPLVAALLSETWISARPEREWLRERLSWWPVPLLTLVVFLVAAAHAGHAREMVELLPVLVPVYVAFLVLAALAAKALATLVGLPAGQGRTLAFSMGTRNSFLVLPVALALPAGWEVAALAIVVQSLVELSGMAAYVRWLPRRLFP